MTATLGLDLGERRIGVAIGDPGGTVATPLATLEYRSAKGLLGELRRLVEQHRVGRIVVGLPKTLRGETGPAAKRVVEQVEWLKASLGGEWILWDERLTTREVERVLLAADVRRSKRREVRDQLAAQRILQTYFDSLRSQGGPER